MQLLNVLESKFQFKAKLIDAKGAWGIARYGRWTGVIGQILNRVNDFYFLRDLESLFSFSIFR